jgi:hypothetical protein
MQTGQGKQATQLQLVRLCQGIMGVQVNPAASLPSAYLYT